MRGHGDRKFVESALLASSASRDWPSLAIDIRRHAPGPIAPFITESTELTLILAASDPVSVYRAAHGLRQSAAARPGTTFIIPTGIQEEATYLTGGIPEVMHLYLADALFDDLSNEDDLPNFHQRNVRYASGICDPTLNWIARRIGRELRRETSSGHMLVETLGLGLAERMVMNYVEGASPPTPSAPVAGLDTTRMRRVLEFVAANTSRPIAIRDMAAVACLSSFHFARAFHAASGKAPHRYLSEQRLLLAKRLLRDADASLASIAASCAFSGQSSFTRAFTGAVGIPPGAFRSRAY